MRVYEEGEKEAELAREEEAIKRKLKLLERL